MQSPLSAAALSFALGKGFKRLCLFILLFIFATVASASAGLVHRWTFDDGTANDSAGTNHGTLYNGATVSGGQLHLDGVNDYFRTSPLAQTLSNRTLMVWVTLSNLTQQGGSALTLEDPTGFDVFDGIIYGEQVTNRWINGSNNGGRWNSEAGTAASPEETTLAQVWIAIVYGDLGSSDDNIKIYRNGVLYADYTPGNPLMTYPVGVADVLIGVRHSDLVGGTGTAEGFDDFLAGSIIEARIYDTALTASQIADIRDNRFTVDSSAAWGGFMNVLDLPADGGAYIFGSFWATADLTALFNSPQVLTLTPNTSIDRDSPNDPFWWKAPGDNPNKNMGAVIYVEDDSLAGSTVTFTGYTVSNSLVNPYTCIAFIRDFVPDYSTFTEVTTPLVAGSVFNLAKATTPGNHIQYGFQTDGPNARLATAPSLGRVQVSSLGAYLPVVVNTNDSGIGSLRQAIADAVSGATITFAPALSGQSIAVTSGHLLVNKNLSIDASALPGGISLDGNGVSRILVVSAGTTATLDSLTMTNGFHIVGSGMINVGNLTMNRCLVTDNHASSDGGGIQNGGTLTLNNSTVSGNSAGNSGGGILNSGTLALNNSTLANNSATNQGGGIQNVGVLIVNSCTLAGNSAATGGGISDLFGFELNNSIVANNTSDNISGTPSGANNLTSGDPLLAPPGNYGGPTQTMPPLPGSPAIDMGNDAVAGAFVHDQRGVGYPRVLGNHVDIGAVEFADAHIVAQNGSNFQALINAQGNLMDAVNFGVGIPASLNGVPFVGNPNGNPSGPNWTTGTTAPWIANLDSGINLVFFTEVFTPADQVVLTYTNLNPAHRHVVQMLHGEPRNFGGTFASNQVALVLNGNIVSFSVPAFTIGNGIPDEDPPASNDIAVVSTTFKGATSFTYTMQRAPTRGPSISAFQIRDLNLVTTNADSGPGSLRSAIAGSQSGDTIVFDPALSGQTITLTSGHLLIEKSLTIDASGLPLGLAISGNSNGDDVANAGESRIFFIGPAATVTLRSLTIVNGYGNGGGGGIFNEGNLILHDATLSGNRARFLGGGIRNLGTLTLYNTTLSGNVSGWDGGGIQNHTTGTLMLYQSMIFSNSAGVGYSGGGIQNSGSLLLTNCILSGNVVSSGGAGGGLFTTGAGATATVLGCLFSTNTTTGATGGGGGGIYADNATMLNCVDSTFSGNVSSNIAGAVHLVNAATGNLARCTFTGNMAWGLGSGGGAVRSTVATLVLEQCTLTANSAAIDGGALFLTGPTSTTLLRQCTLGGNTSPNGGGIRLFSGTLTVDNCILAGNDATNGADILLTSGTLVRAGASLIGDNSTVTTTYPSGAPNGNGDYVGTAASAVNALLAPCGNYGGPTQTMPPLPGSPAINAGGATTLLADQRGLPRVSGGTVDIGAVEVQFVPGINPPALSNPVWSDTGGGPAFQFTFTNVPNADFGVLTTTNVALPLNNWTPISYAVESPAGSGQYQFTTTLAPNEPQRFYGVSALLPSN